MMFFFHFLNFYAIFLEFSSPGQVGTVFGTKIYSFFLGLSHPDLDRNMAGMIFFNFLFFFFYFHWKFLAWVEYEQNSGQKFLSLFLSLSHAVLAKNNAGKRFLIFLLFFSKFSSSGRVWTEFGSKIFFSLSRIISSRFYQKIMPEKRFLIFGFFFSIFLGNFLPGSCMNGIRDEIFFLSISPYLIPVCIEIASGWCFSIFWIS